MIGNVTMIYNILNGFFVLIVQCHHKNNVLNSFFVLIGSVTMKNNVFNSFCVLIGNVIMKYDQYFPCFNWTMPT